MLKKGLPIVAMSALLLGACMSTKDDALPRNDETPMEDIDERERKWAPEMEDERRGGTDLDGIETEEDRRNDELMENNEPFANDEGPRQDERDDREDDLENDLDNR